MSAIGPKRTSLVALHMSAFGGKADMGAFARSVRLGDALALEVGHEARFTTRTSSPRWTNCGMSLLLDPATVPSKNY